MSWFNRKTVSQRGFDRAIAEMQKNLDAAAALNLDLRPGLCECEHPRCVHIGGTHKCLAHISTDLERSYDKDKWLGCTCQIYIPKRDDDGDRPPAPEPDHGVEYPELEELRRMAQLVRTK